MAEVKITDEASLEAWLKTRPRRDAEIIAFRAAARVFPLWGSAMEGEWAASNGFSSILVLRPLLIASVRSQVDGADLEIAAVLATTTNATHDYFGNAHAASYASFAAASAATGQIKGVVDFALNALPNALDASGLWSIINSDNVVYTSDGQSTFSPLWRINPPDWFTAADRETRTIWAKDPPTWAFWEKWWDGVISGDMPFAPELLRDVALIENDIWAAGPKAVAEAIDKLITARALAMTDNGESVAINPDTGKLRLFGADTLPPDIDRYARRKMAKALVLFEGELSNQYRPLDAPMRTIRAALGDSENLPNELFDACASASRMTATLVETQSIPAPDQDPLIGEFVTSLRETAADILAADTNTQGILTKRKAVMGNDTLIAHAGDINIVVGQIVVVSEGALQRMLPENADAALNPNAHPEERNVGAYKLASRLLRIHGKIREIGGTISDYKEVAGLVKLLWANPTFQSVIAAILKYLGLG